jgi:hypothetical protein
MNAQPASDPADIEARLREIDGALREIVEQQEAQNAVANAVEMTTLDVSTDDYAVQRAELLAERRRLMEPRRSAS